MQYIANKNGEEVFSVFSRSVNSVLSMGYLDFFRNIFAIFSVALKDKFFNISSEFPFDIEEKYGINHHTLKLVLSRLTSKAEDFNHWFVGFKQRGPVYGKTLPSPLHRAPVLNAKEVFNERTDVADFFIPFPYLMFNAGKVYFSDLLTGIEPIVQINLKSIWGDSVELYFEKILKEVYNDEVVKIPTNSLFSTPDYKYEDGALTVLFEIKKSFGSFDSFSTLTANNVFSIWQRLLEGVHQLVEYSKNVTTDKLLLVLVVENISSVELNTFLHFFHSRFHNDKKLIIISYEYFEKFIFERDITETVFKIFSQFDDYYRNLHFNNVVYYLPSDTAIKAFQKYYDKNFKEFFPRAD